MESTGFLDMDVRGCGQGLRDDEIEVVAMAVTAVVVNTMRGVPSSPRDALAELRKRRALLQRIGEAPDCVATCQAVIQLCAMLSSVVFPRETPRWWIKRRTGGTWEDLRLCDDATDEYYRQKVRMSMAMFRQVVAACAAYVEKKVTHYRMPLPVEQPYGGIDQGPDEERFDTRQKVARGCVERAFGRLKCMWRLFLRTYKTNLDTLPQQFMAVCTLHNILLDAEIDFDENLLWEVDENGVRWRVDLGIVGNDAGGRQRCTNVNEDLLRDALRDRLALM
ncbi:hypothetical protein CBR_g15985 [Chara braunii]|uniref:DDE Tnp4 domain-containing protein n=1 Tax=Chara braunii TaxID=69332 RepID=A0A388JSS0_CHABU|nr:hypothetical protein CBR_g15985 [Chara braunii]|eukprot:GBG60864.1 hypothetical protein CBR_g15985 [Chara braunii]